MTINQEFKNKILEALSERRTTFGGSDTKFATSLSISPAQFSRIMKGDTEKVLSDANWITIARKLGVNLTNDPDWKTANTPVYQFITAQLEKCQSESLSALLCDASDIGKTYAAQHYVKTHKNAVYVDCSQVKSRQKLIRYIAKEFGVGNTGKYSDVYEDLVFYLKTLPNPLIILDESGDLQYDAFLEIKALWNATEMTCGYYMMGADGLQEKIRRSIDCKKVGYTEVFSRFGKRYGHVIPVGKEEGKNFISTTAAMIIKANAPDNVDVSKLLRSTIGDDGMPSLRRIYTEIRKIG
jgi:DNA transposition AAA+ family ATPase